MLYQIHCQPSKGKEVTVKACEFGADFILAVGGGSVIGTAKFVASPKIDYRRFFLSEKNGGKSLPIDTILTIAVAGSETSTSKHNFV